MYLMNQVRPHANAQVLASNYYNFYLSIFNCCALGFGSLWLKLAMLMALHPNW